MLNFRIILLHLSSWVCVFINLRKVLEKIKGMYNPIIISSFQFHRTSLISCQLTINLDT